MVATGCQVTLTAGVDARSDGSGTVRAGVGFDGEALAELGDPVTELRLNDLREAGWEVAGPRQEEDGLTWIRLAKGFARPAEASRVAAELSGPEGPFRDLRLHHSRSFFKTTTMLTGAVDLTNGLAGLSDPGVQAKLGDADLGLDLEGLRRRFGPSLDEAVQVRFESRLPGRSQSWQPRLGEQVRVETRAESWNVGPVVGAAAALLFAAAALAVVLLSRR
ncbi:MAG: hypothetical protein M3144_06805 [Actinomycetota bacterium]|nr:hypothetical protein [Actinomycetota bacterium]